MQEKIREYILESSFKLNYVNKCVDIINYFEIESFEENKIVVKYKDGLLVVNGFNLVIAKLLDDEILIKGEISSIEFK